MSIRLPATAHGEARHPSTQIRSNNVHIYEGNDNESLPPLHILYGASHVPLLCQICSRHIGGTHLRKFSTTNMERQVTPQWRTKGNRNIPIPNSGILKETELPVEIKHHALIYVILMTYEQVPGNVSNCELKWYRPAFFSGSFGTASSPPPINLTFDVGGRLIDVVTNSAQTTPTH